MTGVTWGDLLKSAGEGGFTPVPPGEYDMYVETATAKQSSSGKDMFALRFKIESGPHEGRNVFSNIVISPESNAASGFFFRKMAAFGLDQEYFDKRGTQSITSTLEEIAGELENRRCVAEVTVRSFSGQDRNDINTIKPPADGVTHHLQEPVPDFGGMEMFTGSEFMPAHDDRMAARESSRPVPPEMPF